MTEGERVSQKGLGGAIFGYQRFVSPAFRRLSNWAGRIVTSPEVHRAELQMRGQRTLLEDLRSIVGLQAHYYLSPEARQSTYGFARDEATARKYALRLARIQKSKAAIVSGE